ncbi:MAG: M73 family metallopeptidase [Actinobacteria bacterium]|nr:M73 family metallopeptidase [Actinomycetota bacterium]
MKTSRKILLSMGSIGAAASIAGLGTFATFTDSESASLTVDSGTVNIALGASGADNRMSVAADGMVPGDTAQRRVKLTNPTGADQQNLASIALTTAATTSSLLDTDATDGLQMKIEKCGGLLGWRESASAPYTYTCDQLSAGDNAGTRTSVVAERAIVGSGIAMSNMAALTVGSTDDMVVTVRLPSSAGNSFQGLSSTVQFTFTATQRAATAQ